MENPFPEEIFEDKVSKRLLCSSSSLDRFGLSALTSPIGTPEFKFVSTACILCDDLFTGFNEASYCLANLYVSSDQCDEAIRDSDNFIRTAASHDLKLCSNLTLCTSHCRSKSISSLTRLETMVPARTQHRSGRVWTGRHPFGGGHSPPSRRPIIRSLSKLWLFGLTRYHNILRVRVACPALPCNLNNHWHWN